MTPETNELSNFLSGCDVEAIESVPTLIYQVFVAVFVSFLKQQLSVSFIFAHQVMLTNLWVIVSSDRYTF